MTVEILHVVFIVNYLYTILVLVWQSRQLFGVYCLQLGLAMTISIVAVSVQRYDFLLVTLCGCLFVVLLLLPAFLSRGLVRCAQRHALAKGARRARWRWWITRALAHRWEYGIFQAMAWIHQKKFAQAEAICQTMLQQAKTGLYRDLLLVQQIIALVRQKRWREATALFEQTELAMEKPLSPPMVRELIHAYCEMGSLERARCLLLLLEKHPEKQTLGLILALSRLTFYVFSGKVPEVESRLAALAFPPALCAYWKAVAYLAAGDRPQAQTLLQEARTLGEPSQREFQTEVERRLAQREQTEPAPLLDAQVWQELEIWERIIPAMSPVPQVAPAGLPCISLLIIGLNLLAFIVLELAGGSTNSLILINFGANAYDLVIDDHQYWRWLSALFLHFGYLHLLLNGLGIYVFGKLIEEYYGGHRLWAIYLFCGLASCWASTYWHTLQQNSNIGLSVGASGSICGLIGAGTYYFTFRALHLLPSIRYHYMFSFFFTIATLVIVGQLFPYLDNAAHLTGLIVGFLLGAIFRASPGERDSLWRKRTLLGLSVLGIALCLYCLVEIMGFLSAGGYPGVAPR